MRALKRTNANRKFYAFPISVMSGCINDSIKLSILIRAEQTHMTARTNLDPFHTITFFNRAKTFLEAVMSDLAGHRTESRNVLFEIILSKILNTTTKSLIVLQMTFVYLY